MSTLKVNQIQDTGGGNSFAPSSISTGLIKAWVNFRGGNGNTTGINDSLGVTSITDNGTGHYFINFSSNFANINYCMTGTATEDLTNSGSRGEVVVAGDRTPHTVGQCRIFSQTTNGSASPRDCGRVELHFVGDT